MTNPRLILAGGSGFLGQALAAHYTDQGYDVVILSRRAPTQTPIARWLQWDGCTVGAWARELDGAAALINLTGKSVNCRYTAANRREIITSRVDSVRVLDAAFQRCAAPPPVWIQTASLAIYGNAGERLCAESAPTGAGFPVETCLAWEQAMNERQSTPRTVILRIGFVLGRDEGALAPLTQLTRAFLGGTTGNGQQYISWLHVADFIRCVDWCLTNEAACGIYNVTGPTPVTNAVFMATLRRVLKRPWSPPIPAFAVHIGAYALGTEANLALHGRRCIPQRLAEEGFQFIYADLQHALTDILSP